MSAAASTLPATTESGLWPHSSDRRGCLARLIGLVRNLIGYGRELAAALQARGLTDRPRRCHSLLRHPRHRADPVTHRRRPASCRCARRPSSCAPPPVRTRSLRRRACHRNAHRAPRDWLPSLPRQSASDPTHLPTPEQIAAEIRRKRVGAVIADICRDLGIVPNHPLWRDLNLAVILNGGGLMVLFKDVCRRTRATWDELTNPPAAPPAPSLPSLEPACTGPP